MYKRGYVCGWYGLETLNCVQLKKVGRFQIHSLEKYMLYYMTKGT